MVRSSLTSMKYFFAIVCLFVSVGFAQTPAAVEKQMIAQVDIIGKTGTYSGSYSDDDGAKNTAANEALTKLLVKYGTRTDILAYSFPLLSKKMSIVTSRDRKFRIYSWDMETGGTLHDYSSVLQYKGASGSVYTWTSPTTEIDDGEEPSSGVGSGGYYINLFQIDTPKGPIYLANSFGMYCGVCRNQAIEIATIEGEKLDREPKLIKTAEGLTSEIGFEYAADSIPEKYRNGFITVNSAARSFTFPIVIEVEDANVGRVTSRTITYRFDGTHFVKVK